MKLETLVMFHQHLVLQLTKMKNKKRHILFLLFISSISIYSQTSEELNNYVQSQIGIQNSHLFNGETYSIPIEFYLQKINS